MRKNSNFFLQKVFYLLFISLCVCCIVPEEPKFEYKDGLIYVDAFASSTLGSSFVKVSQTSLSTGSFTNRFIEGANIFFRNTDGGQVVELNEEEDIYLPPADFYVNEGESWELYMTLPNGKEFRSSPEIVTKPVAFSNIDATFVPDIIYRVDLERFAPGHSISIDIEDPADEENFYYWKFKSFENLDICQTCENSIFRDGECVEPRYNHEGLIVDYLCDGDCWRIRYNETIEVFSDKFTTGTIYNLPIADVILYTNENIVVQVEQVSLSEPAYDYYKVLKDLVDTNSGLNAPPPAALIGNLFNPDDDKEYVLGRFTAASSTTSSIFINRSRISAIPIEPFNSFNDECLLVCTNLECTTNDPECIFITTTPCLESRFRTAITPEGWID